MHHVTLATRNTQWLQTCWQPLQVCLLVERPKKWPEKLTRTSVLLLFLFYFSNCKLNRSISLLRLIFSEQKRGKKRLNVYVEIAGFLIKAWNNFIIIFNCFVTIMNTFWLSFFRDIRKNQSLPLIIPGITRNHVCHIGVPKQMKRRPRWSPKLVPSEIHVCNNKYA